MLSQDFLSAVGLFFFLYMKEFYQMLSGDEREKGALRSLTMLTASKFLLMQENCLRTTCTAEFNLIITDVI